MSMEAEQAVLCAILIDRQSLESALAEGLKHSDFSQERHSLIYKAILKVDESGVEPDLVTVAEFLERHKKLEEAGGREYLVLLTNSYTSFESVAGYAQIIIETARKQKLRAIGYAIDDLTNDGLSSAEIEAEINAMLTGLSDATDNKTSFNLTEALKLLLNRLETLANGSAEEKYTTGIKDLDKMLRLEAGRLYVVAGRPGMGKSTFAQLIAETNAKNGISTLMFSMEMSKEEVTSRIIASQGSLDRGFFKDPNRHASEGWTKFTAAAYMIKDWPLEIDNKTALTISDIKIRASSFFRKSQSYTEKKLGLIVIDYLGLMKNTGQNRVHCLGEITKGLKQLAMKLEIPVVLLHQLNRGVDSRPAADRRPYMSDLRDSGEIEEDADAIVFVYRDEVYNEDTQDKGIAELIVRKSRDGETGAVRVLSQLQFSRFANMVYGYGEGDV